MRKGAGRVVFRTVWSPNLLDGESCFGTTRSAFEKALTTSPGELREAGFRLADDLVRVRIVGRELAERICEPFSHLLAAGDALSSPQLSIDLWDETAAAIPFPGEVNSGPLSARAQDGEWDFTLGSPDDRFVCHRRTQLITWFDRERGQLVGWTPDGRRLSLYDLGKPLFLPLLLWHADRGIVVLHSALVARVGTGVLLVGKEGSGKTSAALTCLRAGFDYLGDDYIRLRIVGGNATGHSLYNTAWGAPAQLASLLDVSAREVHEAPGAGKAVVRLSRRFPDQLAPVAHIAAVAVTHWTNRRESHAFPISPAEALLVVGPGSLLRLPITQTTHLEVISQLLEMVPCFQLTIGQDPDSIVEAVNWILSQGRPS